MSKEWGLGLFWIASFWAASTIVVAPVFSQSAGASGTYQVVHGWPQLPEGFTFGQVSGVGVDSHNHVFVFQRGSGHPVMCFDGASGKLIAAWGDGLFKGIHGLAIDSQDNVWVTDVGHHQVFKFSNDGNLLMTVGAKDVPGEDANHFHSPTDVAVAPSGEFYVSDGYGNSRVAKFSAEGKFLLAWGRKGDQPGEFNVPHGISLDAQGRVYVADRANSRVQVFDGNGNFLAQWKGLGVPWDVTIGSDGYAYVLDGGQTETSNTPDSGRVLKTDLQGHILESWGRVGKYDGQFYFAHQLAVAKNGDVYVTDVIYGMRVQKFARTQGK
jgi:peptidylamidoglycolate lyase